MPARAPSRHSSLAATTRARLVSPGAAQSRDPRASQPPGPDSATLPDVREALDALRHIVQSLRVGSAGADRGGLSSAQLFALQQIGEHPNASVNDIAALTFTHQSSVSVVIQRLVERGLVDKVPSSGDRRRHELALTAKGQRLVRRAPAAVQEDLIAAIASLAAGDRRILARSLGRIAKQIAGGKDSARPPMFFEDDAVRSGQKRQRSR
jgi:DNA-binding MarR family transcriptional regulator